jgi:threonine synthase
MRFLSTRGKVPEVGLREALFAGPAPDGGLYMPASLPLLSESLWKPDPDRSFHDTAAAMARALFEADLPDADLQRLVDAAYDFEIPLVQVEENAWILELFHGPTLAFKDVGARFMAGLFEYYLAHESEPITILVATSGDTGSAIAQAFWRREGVRAVVLYPDGQVSERQRKQFTTLGDNVSAVAIQGTFDDCQALVKQAFADRALRDVRPLASANSINVGRLIPQTFYYIHALTQLPPDEKSSPVFSVPSGNFGNLTAGLMAARMGLPVHHFCASTNVNDVVPRYLDTGSYDPVPSRRTISNAMDVGAPSNFERMTHLFGEDHAELSRLVVGHSFSDEETRAEIRRVFATYNYTMDPHTSVGMQGLRDLQEQHPGHPGIVLATAHPAKFPEVVEAETGHSRPVPKQLRSHLDRGEQVQSLESNYTAFRDLLLGTSLR